MITISADKPSMRAKSSGLCNAATEMTAKMKDGVRQSGGELAVEPTMAVEDVAQAVLYMAGLPLDANVLFMTVMATDMPFVGRG